MTKLSFNRNYWQLNDDQLIFSKFTVQSADNSSGGSSPSTPENGITRVFPGGLLSFRNDYFDAETKPYICVAHNEDISDVVNTLARSWKLSCPSIVLMIISSIRQPIRNANHGQWKNLQEGLIKAANTTSMWIVTNGINMAVAKLVGDAVRLEEQHRQSQICSLHPETGAIRLIPKLVLIGITSSNVLVYENLLDGQGTEVELSCDGYQSQDNKYELNPDHTHFIIVKDGTFDSSGAQMFAVQLADHLMHSDVSNPPESISGPARHRNEIPVVGMLVQGGFSSLKLVLELLKREIPILVLKETGGSADFIAYAYEEIKENKRGEWDPQYVEVFVNSEISRRIAIEFSLFRENNLARNRYRDKVLECIRYCETNGQQFLTFLDIYSQRCNLASLEKEILKALFKSQKRDRLGENQRYDQLQKDLYLTIDWNSPQVALDEVFLKDSSAKFKVDKSVFEDALIKHNREDFIDLFLDQGFQIHKFLTERRLWRLFSKSENPQFFRAVCWEEILGHRFEAKLGRDFVHKELNWLVKCLTGIRDFVPVQELTSNAMGFYTTDPVVAERKALNAVVIWAVLMNRPQLVKVLWKRSDHPLHLALLVAMIFMNLTKYVRSQQHLMKNLEQSSREFERMAVGVLDLSFQQNNCRAMDALNAQMPDWNFQTAVEIAATARSQAFIGHACCQKWLNERFLGRIHLQEFKRGIFTLPTSVKIILSAFLIFPIYIWIHFQTGQQVSIAGADDESDGDEERDIMSVAQLVSNTRPDLLVHEKRIPTQQPIQTRGHQTENINSKLLRGVIRPTTSWIMKPKAWHKGPKWIKEKPNIWYYRKGPQPPLYKKIYLLWSAPITKFWTFQVTYILYLAFFSYIVLLPSCGNKHLDLALWFWTLSILVEIVRRAYIQYTQYRSMPVFNKVVEIILVVVFLVLYLVLRIFKLEMLKDLFQEPQEVKMAYAARVVLCVGLMYFYMRLMVIYFPISPTLGPLLYRMRLMIIIDFYNFMRLAILIILSSGIVIHAIMFPDFPMGKELFRRAFHRTWFSVFITFASDLEESNCEVVTNQYYQELKEKEPDVCLMGDTKNPTCATTGFWPYLMNIQYMVNMKLILLTLLYAMFSNTQMERAADSDAIWKYQRYRLVFDFDTRLRLPPPLTVFSYLLMILRRIYKCCLCKCCPAKSSGEMNGNVGHRKLRANDFNYWRAMATEYFRQLEEAEKKKLIEKEQVERLGALCYNAEIQISALKQLKGSMTELEIIMQNCRIALEDIKHEFVKSDEKLLANLTNLISRQSPYFGTKVQRYSFSDKYVPWEVLFSTYDPVVYSKPREEYSPNVRDYVDEDVLSLREKQGDHFKLPEMKWNIVYTSGAGVTTDRTSWITNERNDLIIYKLDSTGLPINPLGRTGLRGRGALLRWGPNHAIYLALTRFRTEGFLQSVYTEPKTVEFVISPHDGTQWILPGGFMLYHENVYEIVRERFLPQNTETQWSTAEDMKLFFQEFSAVKSDTVSESSGGIEGNVDDPSFTFFLIQRGYLDDALNTDNAWIEAEIWHIHYKSTCTLDGRHLRGMKWRTSASQIKNKMPMSHSNILDKIIHKLEGTT